VFLSLSALVYLSLSAELKPGSEVELVFGFYFVAAVVAVYATCNWQLDLRVLHNFHSESKLWNSSCRWRAQSWDWLGYLHRYTHINNHPCAKFFLRFGCKSIELWGRANIWSWPKVCQVHIQINSIRRTFAIVLLARISSLAAF